MLSFEIKQLHLWPGARLASHYSTCTDVQNPQANKMCYNLHSAQPLRYTLPMRLPPRSLRVEFTGILNRRNLGNASEIRESANFEQSFS